MFHLSDQLNSGLRPVCHSQVQPTTERIDQAKLMNREPILFFEDVVLFEDELHDHGISILSVKVRVMPSGFFLLLRFFLRVDGVVIRVNDTRIYHQADTSYLLREFVTKERYIKDIVSLMKSSLFINQEFLLFCDCISGLFLLFSFEAVDLER
uniref:TIP41-like protein n=1 Tax=Eptatretus burgeri TaxID=7764 RepID=A0A8C4NCP0_EPTBU